ncbi:MAG: U32 family peptidase C-terminal domain-containing protein, partial [Oscillospiraceae bacterium]|nr:U32 family peptidase C-terminal domain-containing protein [Oscillospiraceae bacterium]
GRAKSAYYAAIVTGAYRHVLDDVLAGRTPDPVWRDEVEHISHRHYSTGFYYGAPGQYTQSSRYLRDWQICGIVQHCEKDGMATVRLNNKFAAGDELELVGPDFRPMAFTVPTMQDESGTPLREVKTPGMILKLQLPKAAPAYSILRKAVDLSAE